MEEGEEERGSVTNNGHEREKQNKDKVNNPDIGVGNMPNYCGQKG